MRRNRAVADELHQLGNGRLRRLLIRQHHVRDAGNLGDLRLQWLLGVHQNAQGVHNGALHQLHRTNLDHAAGLGIQTRRLEVQHDDRAVKVPIVRVLHDLRLVDQIALTARNQLDVLALHRVKRRREGLHHAVIRDGYRRMPPLDGTLDEVARRGQRVHRRHVGVHVQLNALFLRRVLPLDALHGHHVPHGNGQLVREIVIETLSAHLDVHALLDLVHLVPDRFALLLRNGLRRRIVVLLASKTIAIAHEALAQHRGRVVRDRKRYQQQLAALELLCLELENIALYRHKPRVAGQLLHLDGLVRNDASHDGPSQRVIRHLRHHGRTRLGLDRLLLFTRRRGLPLPLLGGLLFFLFLHLRRLLQLCHGIGLLLLLHALLTQRRQSRLLIARHGQLHLHVHAEDVLHRLSQTRRYPLPPHKFQ